MDRSLLEQPLHLASSAVRAASSPEACARLRALSPEEYWLAIASELAWSERPTTALDGRLGE